MCLCVIDSKMISFLENGPWPRRSSCPFCTEAFNACARPSATLPATAPVATPPKRSMAREDEALQKAASRKFLGVFSETF